MFDVVVVDERLFLAFLDDHSYDFMRSFFHERSMASQAVDVDICIFRSIHCDIEHTVYIGINHFTRLEFHSFSIDLDG